MKNMKKIICLIAICVCTKITVAQTQELEQLKLNLEKLVQLKLMLHQMKQGYQTLQTGYNSIRDGAKGNFNLHKQYLDELLLVSDQVRSCPLLKKIQANQGLILQEYQIWYRRVAGLGLLNTKELIEIQNKYQEIKQALRTDKELLNMLLQSGTLRMSDAERLDGIEKLSVSSDLQLQALEQLKRAQTELIAQRVQGKKDRVAVRKLYGIK
ncbi:MAG: hypothetical protein IM562_13170 [Chitinophagaceae bacterium]|jgi:hypothetical protein|nr:hypothetical protein [Chitinophagaceae bacterium]MCA6448105.1 hypothetical protein [Chitinophagaceae bacterium]